MSIADIKYQFLELLVDIGFVSVDLKRRRRMGEDDIVQITGTEVSIKNFLCFLEGYSDRKYLELVFRFEENYIQSYDTKLRRHV